MFAGKIPGAEPIGKFYIAQADGGRHLIPFQQHFSRLFHVTVGPQACYKELLPQKLGLKFIVVFT